MLVGNKNDKQINKAVSVQKGLALAQELEYKFVEALIKICINVEKAFYDVVQILC